MGLFGRLASGWKRYSFFMFLRLVVKNFVYYSAELLSGRLIGKSTSSNSTFDLSYDTDTDTIREIGSLAIDSENARHGKRYQPSPQELTTSIISALQIDHRRFAFLDFGAGKGRVLLIAAEWPFAEVIGIEFSRELCSIAADNIRKFPDEKKQASRIECVFGEATTYALPEMPLVCYFYNPFDQVIMQAVMENLISSHSRNPRDILIVYVHPEHRSLFDRGGFWELLAESESHVVYRASTGGLNGAG
ncbi:MAG: class I SAM-dependent methyltransferase [Desulfobacteraceae bacterium]|nr:MAG: class I SAM-dependent methyltransferase [Desulfobacteraceae bacterium]